MTSPIQAANMLLNTHFLLLLFLIPLHALKVPEKYFIELPHSFYLNLTTHEKPLELWHPRLVLSQIIGDKPKGETIEKRPGVLKPKLYRAASSFLEISSQDNNFKSNKMACACKFIPEYAGQKEEKSQNTQETVLIQKNTNGKEEKEEKNIKTIRNRDEVLLEEREREERPEKQAEKEEKQTRNEEKQEKTSSKADLDKKELLEMYAKLEKLLSSSEEKPENQQFSSKPQQKPTISSKKTEFSGQNRKNTVFIPQEEQESSRYVLQPAVSNGLGRYQRRLPQTLVYQDMWDNGYYDSSLFQQQGNGQDNLVYVPVRKKRYVVVPSDESRNKEEIAELKNDYTERYVKLEDDQHYVIRTRKANPQRQQIVYLDSEGEVLGY